MDDECNSFGGVAGDDPQVLDWLAQRYETRMTGTGACVFARFATRKLANEAIATLPDPWQGFVAQGLNRSPLVERLNRELTGTD